MNVHRYTNPVRATDNIQLYLTICGETVQRYQCVASDFKTTCEACIQKIIAIREKELELLRLKVKPDNWKLKDLSGRGLKA
ncbi:hypothetical protein UFOVP903_20 [uncultured Caudovirales phage]|uniref:Uncharacterized protein n=1 Tax=uncultured Caudovirales phage TaxID=2100421 RepID=A0A6J5PD54_9CAUD|nr:hypothetical protein UFOVP903_20 [uncultured Caudovirales phage]CAB4197614.1 hypothetical protein UFOVP1318_26 [uncultured Caudovirales phage]CAB4210466.1 hypothetical protein UFOVP1430_18 [uncultured Caudovirales phage]